MKQNLRELIKEQEKDAKKRRVYPQIFSDIKEKDIIDVPGETLRDKLLFVSLLLKAEIDEISQTLSISRATIYRKRDEGF